MALPWAGGGVPFQGEFFGGSFSHGVAMGWRKSAPYGASDLAAVRTCFLKNLERLIHGIPVAKRPVNLEM
jgi:hypothetical protein